MLYDAVVMLHIMTKVGGARRFNPESIYTIIKERLPTTLFMNLSLRFLTRKQLCLTDMGATRQMTFTLRIQHWFRFITMNA
mmetsp:Transcript_59380/g.69412  ORF Transcript_59380/g.69412 Transcript_59380/m.69412 type:complete len:81 (-) Transcript_59380:33-275(-)